MPRYEFYAADLARTFALGGQPTRRQQAVYDAVFEAQAYAFSLLKPGVKLKDYEKDMENFVGEKLRELGLIKTIDRDSVRQLFPTCRLRIFLVWIRMTVGIMTTRWNQELS